MKQGEFIREVYEVLYRTWGPLGWWPGRDEEDIIIGAVLTQNTSWRNVRRAMDNLEARGLCRLRAIAKARHDRLAVPLHPVGYFNLKAKRLKSAAKWFVEKWDCDWARLRAEPTATLREALLEVHGVGPETADSILLYALDHPIFVVDAYTKRILSRHGIADAKASYDEIQRIFEKHLPRERQLFNEYHALLVKLGNNLCKGRKPLCDECPLGERRFFTAKAGREKRDL